jgi:hypothetical protein
MTAATTPLPPARPASFAGDWRRDPFFQYPLGQASTSAGEVALPILYQDCSSLVAMYWVDLAQAQALVAPQGLRAVRFGGGRALLALAFYEYRQTAIADYNEVGTALAVVPEGVAAPAYPMAALYTPLDKRQLGFCVLDLPVTTAAACAAGREIWGYPKFVTPIAFRLDGSGFHGAVTDPQQGAEAPLLALAGRPGPAVASPWLDLVVYSRHEGRLLRTLVNTRGGGLAGLGGSLRLAVSAGSAHPMATRLRALGLQGAKPFAVMQTRRLQLRLNAGAVVG